jgi:dihydroorotase (multifunctional complex type)
MYILPGAIDIHVHLRDLNDSEKEDYLTGTRAAAAGGVTSVIDMPNSNPPVLDRDVLEEKISSATSKRYVNVGFYSGIPKSISKFDKTLGSLILGVKVYPHSPLAKGVKYNQERITDCSKLAAELDIPLLLHPDSSDSATKPSDKDDFFRLHSCESEVESLERFISVRNEIENRLHVCHVSCRATARLIAENRDEINLTAEVAPHHLFMNSTESIHEDGTAKMLPPLRSPYDSTALMLGLRQCTIDCVASDHAPHLESDKNKSFLEASSGIPGLETTLPLLLTEVFEGQLTWAEYLRCCCSGPALIMGLKDKGVLARGYDADITVVKRESYQIKGSEFESKAKITPFEGRMVHAKPVMTIVGGQLVYSNGEFLTDPGIAGKVPMMR